MKVEEHSSTDKVQNRRKGNKLKLFNIYTARVVGEWTDNGLIAAAKLSIPGLQIG
jgi:hypothetical protein